MRSEVVEHLAAANNLTLIHNAKLPKSSNSKQWKSGNNPDRIFASTNIGGMCEKKVLDPIPYLQQSSGYVTT